MANQENNNENSQKKPKMWRTLGIVGCMLFVVGCWGYHYFGYFVWSLYWEKDFADGPCEWCMDNMPIGLMSKGMTKYLKNGLKGARPIAELTRRRGAKATLPYVIDVLREGDEEARAAAAHFIFTIASSNPEVCQNTVSDLVAALGDESPRVVVYSLWALSSIGDMSESFLDRIIELQDHSNEDVRLNAKKAIQTIKKSQNENNYRNPSKEHERH